MITFIKKTLILARSDIVPNIHAAWYFVALFVGPILMISAMSTNIMAILSNISDSGAIVAVVDKINNPYSQNLLNEISSEGYKLVRRDDYAEAISDVKNDRAYFALYIQEDGKVRVCFNHAYDRDDIIRTVDSVVKKDLIEKYENRRKKAKSPLFRLHIEHEEIFKDVPERSEQYAGLSYKVWSLAMFLSVVIVILSKESYSKLRRKYSPLELLLGKIISSFTLTFIIGIIMCLTLVFGSIKCSSYVWAFINVAIACLSGVMVGLILGLIPVSLKASMADTLLGGLLGVAVFYLLSNSVGGTFFPITSFPPILKAISDWLPVYPLIRFTNWTAVLGRGLDYVVVRELFIRLIQIFVIQFLICLALLKRL